MCAETKRAEMQRTEDVHVAMLARDMNYAEEVIHDVYAAMRNHISVRLPFMVALSVAIGFHQLSNYSGVLGRGLVYVPLSIFGDDGQRFRIPIMNDLHEATLTARMSEIAMDVLREALHKHDLDMLFLCCCGLVIGKRDRIDEFYGSQDHVERDRVRSFFDTEATGITMTDSINDLRKRGVVSLDFDPYSYSEDRLFEKIECMLGTAKQFVPLEQDSDVAKMKDQLTAIAQRVQQAA